MLRFDGLVKPAKTQLIAFLQVFIFCIEK